MNTARRTSYAVLQRRIIKSLPRTYGPIIAKIYRYGWLEGSMCAVGGMPEFNSMRMNVNLPYHRDRDIDYITRNTALEWELEEDGRLSFDLMRLRQWLTLEETTSLIFYQRRVEVTEARKWKSLLRNDKTKKYRR